MQRNAAPRTRVPARLVMRPLRFPALADARAIIAVRLLVSSTSVIAKPFLISKSVPAAGHAASLVLTTKEDHFCAQECPDSEFHVRNLSEGPTLNVRILVNCELLSAVAEQGNHAQDNPVNNQRPERLIADGLWIFMHYKGPTEKENEGCERHENW